MSDSNGSGSLARRARLARRRPPWLLPRLEALHDGLAADKGGPEALSVAEGVLVELAVDSYAVCLFLMHNIETRGAVKRDGNLRPAVLSLATFQNTLRLHLQALGLQRRARDVTPDLRSLWKRRDAVSAPAAGANGPGSGPDPSQAADRSPKRVGEGGFAGTEGDPGAFTRGAKAAAGPGARGPGPELMVSMGSEKTDRRR